MLAEDIIKGDRTINDMERAIEARCLSLILRQQPVAGDLRQVSTALKVVTDLERIGDHASDIAELVLRLKSDHAYHIVKHLPAMAAAAGAMVHDAIEAFISHDLEEMCIRDRYHTLLSPNPNLLYTPKCNRKVN